MKKIFICALFALNLVSTSTATAQPEGKKTRIELTESAKPARNNDPKANAIETEYSVEWSDGKEYTIYLTKANKRAFIILTSKTKGTEYRKYLGNEMSERVNKAMGN